MKCPTVARSPGATRPAASCILLALASVLATPALASAPTRSVGEEPCAGGGWLGVRLRPAGGPDAGGAGLVVLCAMPLSPADRAGLRPGDVILSCNRRPCGDPEQFLAMLSADRPGDLVHLTVQRDARTLPVRVQLQGALGPLLAPLPPGGAGRSLDALAGEDRRLYLGVQVIGLTESLAPYFKTKAQEGVLVTHVERNGPAARAGLLAGDVIRTFADHRVHSPAELRAALDDVGAGKHDLRVLRRGKHKTLRMSLLGPPEHGPWEDVAIYLSRRDLERLREDLVRGEPAAWRDLARLRGEVEGLRATLRSFEHEARWGAPGAR